MDTMTDIVRDPARLFAPPQMRIARRDDGSILLDSGMPLAPYARCVGDDLEYWAGQAPERPFLLERSGTGDWAGLSYRDTLDRVTRLATWLLGTEAGPERPAVVLSDNSTEHALLMLACLHVGVPYSAISPAYSLVSQDHQKLKNLIDRLDPAVLYVDDPARFGAALESVRGRHRALLVTKQESDAAPGALPFAELLGRKDEAAVRRAFEAIGPDTVGKILFTSGSTGEPKGVINTQRMLCAPQQSMAQLWPFLAETPPVLLDWLPWNHTFGSNHNFNLILKNGGTLYLDGGKPMPGLFDTSVRNLREVRPTLYLNVPRAFDMLVPVLRADAEFRKAFFSRLQVIFYAAAALPQTLWDALIELSTAELGRPVPMVTSWGATETAPLASHCNYQAPRSGIIGLPIPGVQLKLVPSGDKLEVRVKGPNVTPGYYKEPEATAKAFDEEGFYRIGDAVRFADPAQPELGLEFDGRVTEDFKLSSGTWVNVGKLRVKGIEVLSPLAQDIVVTGHDREAPGFMIFPNVAACRQLAGLPPDTPLEQVLAHERVRQCVAAGMAKMKRDGGGSSTYPVRALLLAEPASVDGNEITDKGYINQAAVLKRRAELVELLHAPVPAAQVIGHPPV
jgi:feruloyl-CoA synthase